jgi:hypothetical protein
LAPAPGVRARTRPRPTRELGEWAIFPTEQEAASKLCSTLAKVAPRRKTGTTHGGGGETTVVCALAANSGGDSRFGYSKYAQNK